jgi:hypothetical protein
MLKSGFSNAMPARPSRPRTAAAPPTHPSPTKTPAPAPPWLRWVVLALAAALLWCTLAGEVGDTDTWWHLKTGQYIVQNHKLPVPDPFAYTTSVVKDAYPGEATTRYFNLTHEWLAQVFLWGLYSLGGFPAMVAMRAIWLTAFCGLAGWVVWRRTGGFYRATGAALAVLLVAQKFATDRPQYITYVFLGLALAILESRRRLWLLPPLLLVWANCHAGFFLGWVILGAYCGEALFQRLRGKPPADEKQLWAFSLGAILISGLNPNHFHVLEVMRYYRQSPMQSNIWEWQYPKYWELSPFTLLLYGALLVLLLNWRRTRLVDWLLLVAFGASGLLAYRNIILAAFMGSLLIASYLPASRVKATMRDWAAIGLLALAATAAGTGIPWYGIAALLGIGFLFCYGQWPVLAEGGLAVFLATAATLAVARGAIQPRAAEWKIPAKAADFLLQHHIQGHIFNTYVQGGYLIWRLYPTQQVFIDGRALSDTLYQDMQRIIMNADQTGGKTSDELLSQYGVDVIVMDTFEPLSGLGYYLPAALADPAQKEWKLVYQDIHDVIYMRHPPPDVAVLNSIDALSTMEQQCSYLVEHGAPACSRGLWDIFTKIGDRQRARKWLETYRDTGGVNYETR